MGSQWRLVVLWRHHDDPGHRSDGHKLAVQALFSVSSLAGLLCISSPFPNLPPPSNNRMAALNHLFNLLIREFVLIVGSPTIIRKSVPQELQLRWGKNRQHSN